MSESSSDTTDTTETTPRPHLQPVPESNPAPVAAQGGAVRQSSGGHMTGLLALLLAVSVFAFLTQFSSNQVLKSENLELRDALAVAQGELDASRGQMTEARDALGGLRDVMERIETLLAPPAAPTEAVVDPAPEAVAAE